MREVTKMDVRVIAYPSDGSWVVECSEHGFLVVASDTEVDRVLVDHLTSDHGARVPA